MFLVGTAVAAFKGCVGKALGFEPPRMPMEQQAPKWLMDMAQPPKTD